MTAQELTAPFPNLYHVTVPGAWSLIKEDGLLPSSTLAERAAKSAVLERGWPATVDLGEGVILKN